MILRMELFALLFLTELGALVMFTPETMGYWSPVDEFSFLANLIVYVL